MAVGDLTGDGRPEVVIADKGDSAVMVYRNTSSPAGAPCFNAPPTARNDVATRHAGRRATAINVLANDTDPDGGPKSSPPSRSPRTAPRRSAAAA